MLKPYERKGTLPYEENSGIDWLYYPSCAHGGCISLIDRNRFHCHSVHRQYLEYHNGGLAASLAAALRRALVNRSQAVPGQPEKAGSQGHPCSVRRFTGCYGFLPLRKRLRIEAIRREAECVPEKEDLSAVRVETYPYTQSEYGPVYLDAYWTEDGKADKPVLIYIHGGGWIQGSRETHAYYPKVFANHGYVAFTLEYDLSSPERHLAESTELQIAEAFAWVKNHAADFGGDITRLCVAGGSAGGNLALELAYKIDAGIYQTAADGTELPTVRAASVTFPATSVVAVYNNDDLVLGDIVHNMAYSYTGCSPEENPALYDSLAPGNYITASTPPTNIVLGAGDVIVPTKETYELDAALEQAGIAHQTVTIPYANHGFDAVDGNMGNRAYLDLSLRWFEQYLGKTGDK